MTANAILNIHSIKNEDLTVPTATARYPVGMEVTVVDANNLPASYIYIQAETALVAYVPYMIRHDGTDLKTLVPATGASRICVPQVAFTDEYYGFALIKGAGSVVMSAETYAAGDFLQVLNTGVIMVVDGTSGSTVELVTSCAVCTESGSTAVARGMYLLGTKADIAAT